MADEKRVLRDYYVFTIPQVSVFAGAILGILFILRLKVELVLGLFSVIYGVMLTVIHLVVYPHFKSNPLYRFGLAFSVVLLLAGIYLVALGINMFSSG
ncbi:hypothetical protein [Thermococcus zilligii]|uniref:hypothetical protein n=1 Tax=Thermococcus zilligii TaxID=54076 RepID=UPI00029A2E75|nr:hypothetical protein [Thermococcus zilligii]